MINHVEGDLIKMAKAGEFDVIAHGCNCQCRMGRGIALTIKNELHKAYLVDQATDAGSRAKLGTCSIAIIGDLTVINAYTQWHWRGNGVLVDYGAVRSCMQHIADNFQGKRIGLPLIGAGLAGGCWPIIE